jgi:4-alpha-glucanotransferase
MTTSACLAFSDNGVSPMKIVFRLNYHTVPGQSLWLINSIDQNIESIPMRWLNDEQWEISLDFSENQNLPTEYHYQLRQENGVELNEWKSPRLIHVDPIRYDHLLLLDTWCSAGTVDYAFETKVFNAVLPVRGPFQLLEISKNTNHRFQLRMAAVPAGQVPCLIGNIHELGNWDKRSAVPLEEISPNVWQTNINLPADGDIEYKYGLFDRDHQRAASLELGGNRKISSRGDISQQLTLVNDECYHRDDDVLFKGAGVAIPVFSLRSEQGLGVGEFADLKLHSNSTDQ